MSFFAVEDEQEDIEENEQQGFENDPDEMENRRSPISFRRDPDEGTYFLFKFSINRS